MSYLCRGAGTFGSATAMVTLPGGSPRLSADIAEIRADYGAVNVIEDQDLATGTTQTVTLRAEDPNASFGSPKLSLVSGRYPDAPGQVAMTSSVASLYGVKTGGIVRLAGRSWTVTGIVEDPSKPAGRVRARRAGAGDGPDAGDRLE